MEIERKFILDAVPAVEMLGRGQPMRQGYLAEQDAVSVRVRITDRDATLTVKGGRGLQRTEVEVALSVDQAEDLWPLTERRRIDKTRHRVDLPGGADLVAEVDVYAGDLIGLCTVEVEFGDAEAAAAFEPPPWFGRELTGDDRWSNASLARAGLPAD